MSSTKLLLFPTLFISIFALFASQVFAVSEVAPVSASPNELILVPQADYISDTAFAQAVAVMSRRLAQANLRGSADLSIDGHTVMVNLTELVDKFYVATLLTTVGEVAFIDGGSEFPPLGETVRMGEQNEAYQRLFITEQLDAFDQPANGELFYVLELNETATTDLDQFFADHPANYICSTVDSTLINCSSLYYWADGTLEILPNLSSHSPLKMDELKILAHSGQLPVPFELAD